MPITFNCPTCNQQLSVQDSLAGQRGRCPKCKATINIPGPAASPLPIPTASQLPDSLPVASSPAKAQKFCHECGAQILAKAAICPKCGVAQPVQTGTISPGRSSGGSNRMAAGLLAIFLGGLGIHKFIMGYPAEGAILLCVNMVCLVTSCCIYVPIIGCIAIVTIALIEGVIYLSKTDEEFHQIYEVGRRPWF